MYLPNLKFVALPVPEIIGGYSIADHSYYVQYNRLKDVDFERDIVTGMAGVCCSLQAGDLQVCVGLRASVDYCG